MKRVISLAQHTTPRWAPPEMIYNAHHLGYQAVGIRAIRQGVAGESCYELARDARLLRLTRQALAETGVLIHDIDLIAINEQTKAEQYREDLETAASLGARGVVCSVWTDQERHYQEQFAALCDLAQSYRLKVHLEFVTWARLRNLCEALALLELVKRPNARILLDTIHCYRSGVTLAEIEAAPQHYFELVHICDAPREIPRDPEQLAFSARNQRLYPGEGCIDLAGILGAAGTEAVIGVEIPHTERHTDLGALEHARRCLEQTRQYLKQHDL